MKYCSYQDRSKFEVEQKAFSLGVKNKQAILECIAILEKDKFLDNERFANQYVLGKRRQKRWGRYKIQAGLYEKGIDSALASTVLGNLKDLNYTNDIEFWIEKKSRETDDVQKIIRFVASKGFEMDNILSVLKSINK